MNGSKYFDGCPGWHDGESPSSMADDTVVTVTNQLKIYGKYIQTHGPSDLIQQKRIRSDPTLTQNNLHRIAVISSANIAAMF